MGQRQEIDPLFKVNRKWAGHSKIGVYIYRIPVRHSVRLIEGNAMWMPLGAGLRRMNFYSQAALRKV